MIDGRLTENYPERFLRCARGKNIQLQITHKTHNIPLWIHLINQVYSELGNSCLLYAHLVKATLFYTFLQKKERKVKRRFENPWEGPEYLSLSQFAWEIQRCRGEISALNQATTTWDLNNWPNSAVPRLPSWWVKEFHIIHCFRVFWSWHENVTQMKTIISVLFVFLKL